MNLYIPLTQISGSRRTVCATYLDPEKVICARLTVVSHGNLEVHRTSAYGPSSAEGDLVWASLYETKNLT